MICLSVSILSNTQTKVVFTSDSKTVTFSQKHLNYTLHERGRDTETKLNWLKLSVHVSPDKVGD